MRPYRNLKMGSVIEQELGKLMERDFKIEGALVTITGVDVGEDLLQATVKLGIIPYEKGPEVFDALKKERGRFQHLLLKKMNVRPMPQIRFVVDDETLPKPVEPGIGSA